MTGLARSVNLKFVEFGMMHRWVVSIGEGRMHHSDVPYTVFEGQDEDGYGQGNHVGSCRLDGKEDKKLFAGRSFLSNRIIEPVGIQYVD